MVSQQACICLEFYDNLHFGLATCNPECSVVSFHNRQWEVAFQIEEKDSSHCDVSISE